MCLRDDAGRLFELRLHGNMSSASIPLTVEAYRDGRSVKTEALVTLQMEGEAVKTAEKGAEAEGNEDTLLQQVKDRTYSCDSDDFTVGNAISLS